MTGFLFLSSLPRDVLHSSRERFSFSPAVSFLHHKQASVQKKTSFSGSRWPENNNHSVMIKSKLLTPDRAVSRNLKYCVHCIVFRTAAWQQMGEKCLLLGTFCLYFIHVYCTDAKWLEQMWAAVFDLFVDSVSVLFFIVLLLEWIWMETFILNVFNKYALCPTCSVRDEIHCTEIHSTYVKQNNKPFI